MPAKQPQAHSLKSRIPPATGTATHSGNSQGIRNIMQVPLLSEMSALSWAACVVSES